MAMIFHDIRMNFSCRDYTEAKVHRTVKNMMKSILTLKVLKGIIITLSEKTGFTKVRLIFRLRFGTLGNVCIK
jgi:hypothetical protein